MSWDITAPAGSDAVSNGDDKIRELKTDLQTSLRGDTTDGLEGKFPGSDTSNPIFRYRGLKGTTAARPATGQYGLYHNETLNTIQRDSGTNWEDIATLFPSGTVALFWQSAAPVGWTQVVTNNDKAIRVVSGTGGGSGGTTAFTSCWVSATSGNGGLHTPTVASMGLPTVTAQDDEGGSPGAANKDHIHTGVTLNEVADHTHSVTSYAPHYINIIACSKD